MRLEAHNISLFYPIFGRAKVAETDGQHVVGNTKIGGDIVKIKNRSYIRALHDINFRLKAGDRLGLIGHNGSGKTTLLRTLAGIYKPQAGSVVCDGEIDGVFDLQLGFRNEASGLKNIYIKGAILGKRQSEIDAVVDTIIEMSELKDYIHMPMKTYSSGMRMRFAFAVSTAFTQDILVLDEWIGAGDERFRETVIQRWKDFTQSAQILVLATHNLKLIEEITTQVIWLEGGKMKMVGKASEIVPQYRAYMHAVNNTQAVKVPGPAAIAPGKTAAQPGSIKPAARAEAPLSNPKVIAAAKPATPEAPETPKPSEPAQPKAVEPAPSVKAPEPQEADAGKERRQKTSEEKAARKKARKEAAQKKEAAHNSEEN